MSSETKVRILFVCMGNICRSPLAEGVFRSLVEERGLSSLIEIDSAGTGSWHAGQPPDRRMRQTAHRHGISLDDQRARAVRSSDLYDFDLLLMMDRDNLNHVRRLDRKGAMREKLRLFRDFDPDPGDGQVPDPYYGGADGFEDVYCIVDRTARNLLDWVERRYLHTADPGASA